MTLRYLIQQAAIEIDRYKHPSIPEETKARLIELVDLACGGVLRDPNTVDSIEVDEDDSKMVRIQITYYAIRQGMVSDIYEFPSSILDAEDPSKAAKSYFLDSRLEELRTELSKVQTELHQVLKSTNQCEVELQLLTNKELGSNRRSTYAELTNEDLLVFVKQHPQVTEAVRELIGRFESLTQKCFEVHTLHKERNTKLISAAGSIHTLEGAFLEYKKASDQGYKDVVIRYNDPVTNLDWYITPNQKGQS